MEKRLYVSVRSDGVDVGVVVVERMLTVVVRETVAVVAGWMSVGVIVKGSVMTVLTVDRLGAVVVRNVPVVTETR